MFVDVENTKNIFAYLFYAFHAHDMCKFHSLNGQFCGDEVGWE
jgi:hypothetical protein